MSQFLAATNEKRPQENILRPFELWLLFAG